jgi:predicted transcriptional regulator YheO
MGGRPEALDADRRKLSVELYEPKKMPIGRICETMGISKPTLYKYLREERDK